MKKLILLSALCCCVAGLFAQAKNEVKIVPLPVSCKVQSGEFEVTPTTKIVLSKDDAQLREAVAVFNERFATAAGFSLPVAVGKEGSNMLYCVINPKLGSNEAYKLTVAKNKVRIEAKTPSGIFYATQTLRQLLPPQIESSQKAAGVRWKIPCVKVDDAPLYSYRGLHLDVVRHFFGKEDVMRYIDLLAYHKMNTFHWHLTDDQGWRIEIKKHPKLTTVGATRTRERKGTNEDGHSMKWEWVSIPHSGYYTQDDVREVIAYANKRFVTVIPEIEMPGHARAALAAYPNLSCSGGPIEVEGDWGIFEDIFCTREETFTFLEDVLTEVAELFPSKYIHVGGDEAPKLRWERCHACQTRMKEEGLKDEHELQSYFITRMEKFLNGKGKQIIGWDEILEGGLAPNATVMSWRGNEGGIAAAKASHNAIMTPTTHMYLDYYQADPKTQPVAIGGFLPLDKVYSYNPTPKELTPAEAKYILGVQANLWSEYLPVFDQALYMAYPRAAAVAEIGWTPVAQKNYDNFRQRMRHIAQRYDAMGIKYCNASLGE